MAPSSSDQAAGLSASSAALAASVTPEKTRDKRSRAQLSEEDMPKNSKQVRTQSGKELASDTFSDAVDALAEPTAAIASSEAVAADYGDDDDDVIEPSLEDMPNLLMVEMQKEDEESVAEALKQFLSLVTESDSEEREEHQKSALKFGAPPLVILTMRKWQRNEQIQTLGCKCLKGLAMPNEGANSIGQRKQATSTVNRSGGIEAIASAMKIFPDSLSDIRVAACGALVSLLRVGVKDEPEVRAVAVRFIEESNGLELIMKSMNDFPGHSILQRSCCRIFCNLAQDKELRTVLIKAGVLAAVSTSLQNHSEDTEVKRLAASFMHKMFPKPL